MADNPEAARAAARDADPLLALDNQLCFSLYASSLAVTRLYKPLLAPLGLTYPQYLVMLVLWEHGESSVNQIGHTLQLDSGTLTPLLKRLEAAELIQRRRDPADERRVLITLTGEGHALRDRARAVPHALMCRMGVSDDELVELQRTLRSLRARLTAALPG